jgi:cyanate lyase
LNRTQATELMQEARRVRRLSFTQLASELGQPPVWLTAALLGQHPINPGLAQKVLHLLQIPEAQHAELIAVLKDAPMRGSFETWPPTDPTVYRLYEVLQVYGPALKELLHEEFGDGIMSAINFQLDVQRQPHPGGDRVVITLNGKFLPYAWEL